MTNETEVEVLPCDIAEADAAVIPLLAFADGDELAAYRDAMILAFARHRIASRATDTALVERVVDSGMSAKAVERAEWLWANLPTGRKWTGLATHEKALVCHILAVLEGKRT